MNNELRPWEVARMIEEAGGPVELEVWDIGPSGIKNNIVDVDMRRMGFLDTDDVFWEHARLPQKPERLKITDRYRLMKRCRELDAQGNGILVRFIGSNTWGPWNGLCYSGKIEYYEYTHLDDNGQPIGEPQDFWEEVC